MIEKKETLVDRAYAFIVVEVTPDPSQIQSFTAPGLSLGGRHTWKYTYRFDGVFL